MIIVEIKQTQSEGGTVTIKGGHTGDIVCHGSAILFYPYLRLHSLLPQLTPHSDILTDFIIEGVVSATHKIHILQERCALKSKFYH